MTPLRPGTYTIVWRYEVHAHRVAEFRARYGPRGDWAQLFSRSAGYRGTDLLEDRSDPLTFCTLDRWESEAAFLAFRDRHGQAYREMDSTCDALTRLETHIGSFTELP